MPAGAAWPFVGRTAREVRGVSLRRVVLVGNDVLPARPKVNAGRYWKLLIRSSESSGEVGLGPLGLGPLPSPLAATHTSVLRAGVAAAATG